MSVRVEIKTVDDILDWIAIRQDAWFGKNVFPTSEQKGETNDKKPYDEPLDPEELTQKILLIASWLVIQLVEKNLFSSQLLLAYHEGRDAFKWDLLSFVELEKLLNEVKTLFAVDDENVAHLGIHYAHHLLLTITTMLDPNKRGDNIIDIPIFFEVFSEMAYAIVEENTIDHVLLDLAHHDASKV